jgi:uncharacterized membrane protein (DUF485 family)
MENNIIIGIASFIIAYIVIKLYIYRNLYKSSDYERQIVDILNKDEHKVKGRFE